MIHSCQSSYPSLLSFIISLAAGPFVIQAICSFESKTHNLLPSLYTRYFQTPAQLLSASAFTHSFSTFQLSSVTR